MSEIESSIKPEDEQPIKHDLNDKTWESYVEQGFKDNIPHPVESKHERLMRFIAEAGDRPIEKKVEKMERVKIKGKEYLLVQLRLSAFNFFGEEKLVNGEYIEGYWVEQTRKPKRDEQRRIISYVQGTPIEHYTIEFNKENVDKYIGDQDHNEIDFFIKHEGGPQSDHFTYEQFVNNAWEDNMELLLIDGSPKYARFNKPKPRK